MNKRSMIRIGILGSIAAMGFIILFLVSTSFAFIQEKEYFIGDEARIDLSEVSNYMLKIETPTKTLLKEGSNDVFIFPLDEIGEHIFILKSEDYSETQILNVLEKGGSAEKLSEKSLNKSHKISSEKISISNGNDSSEAEEGFLQEQIVVGESVKQKKKISFNEAVNEALIDVLYLGENFSVSQENESKDFEIQNNFVNKIESLFVENATKQIKIENANGEVEIIYETPAPEKIEKALGENKKEVVVSADDSLGYENVLVSTNLSGLVKDKNKIKIFWKEENKYLDFNVSDFDFDGFIDGVSWIVPHLSEQT
ncbi:MAG: hypothetical protein PVJ67_06485, partial [Candidatus Pacearchaeota archaeon]